MVVCVCVPAGNHVDVCAIPKAMRMSMPVLLLEVMLSLKVGAITRNYGEVNLCFH